MVEKLKEAFKARMYLMVTVLSAAGEEKIISFKEGQY